MAVGNRRMFGIKMPVNFFSPYRARNVIEFWRRWPITLSRFLRDYLYIPLTGRQPAGQGAPFPQSDHHNDLGGLWHGASWNFILWVCCTASISLSITPG
jgi:D-alanyl-lipoteichoic acid acyltransferase DltB (MBOAT superfamily)